MDLKPSTTIDEQLVLIERKGIHINNLHDAEDFLARCLNARQKRLGFIGDKR